MTFRSITCALLAGIVMVFCSLAGCTPKEPAYRVQPQLELTWPDAPLPPRIAWRGMVEKGEEGTLHEGFWRRLVGVLFGRRKAGVVRPAGVYRDAGGTLFVVDSGAAAVHMIDPQSGRFRSLRAGDKVEFRTPVGISGNGDGTVYITDAQLGTVFRYDIESRVLEPFAERPLRQPTGVAFHPGNGLLYVVETAAHRVVALDRQGQVRLSFGRRGAGEGEFNYPTAVAVAPNGRVLVNDTLNGRIQFFSPGGESLHSFGALGDTAGYFARPKDLALDSDGHVYVTDALLDTVQIFDSQGRFLLHFGSRGQEAGQFWMPSGIFIDAQDRIFVVDTYNRRVQVFDYLGGEKGDRGWSSRKRD